jgi:hypothetical protein
MSGPSERRQSARAVRSTASRPQNYYAPNSNNVDNATATDAQPRSFPAIEHFTDAIAAIPPDMARQFSMLREVDAKLHGPEAHLSMIAEQMARLPPPSANYTNGQNGTNQAIDSHRLTLYRQFHHTVQGMLPALDEKTAVLANANEQLKRLNARALDSYKYIPQEISSEARLGNLKHWAYVNEKEPKKAGNERTRREVAAANNSAAGGSGNAEVDAAHARSEVRREAMIARRARNQQQDSDFEERGPQGKPKARVKNLLASTGLEFRPPKPNAQSAGPGAVPKRRKVPAGVVGGESSMASALSGQKHPPGSPTPGTEEKRKRKTAPGPAPAKKRLVML